MTSQRLMRTAKVYAAISEPTSPLLYWTKSSNRKSLRRSGKLVLRSGSLTRCNDRLHNHLSLKDTLLGWRSRLVTDFYPCACVAKHLRVCVPDLCVFLHNGPRVCIEMYVPHSRAVICYRQTYSCLSMSELRGLSLPYQNVVLSEQYPSCVLVNVMKTESSNNSVVDRDQGKSILLYGIIGTSKDLAGVF